MSLLPALLRLAPLDRLPRTGWLLRGVDPPESIAGHVLGTAQVALALAAGDDGPLDLGRLLTLVLVHDAPEAASGDLPAPAGRHLPPGAKAEMEGSLARELLGPLGSAEAFEEFAAGQTREARLARLSDRLQLGVRLVEYRRAGWAGLEEFRTGLEALDCDGFPAAEGLRVEILGALDELGPPPA